MYRMLANLVVVAGILMSGSGVVTALTAQEKPVVASNGWVMVPAAGQTTTEAYVSIQNPTMYDIYVVSATTDAADKVEFRDVTKQGDASAQVVKELTVPAFDGLGMTPKGLKMVLTGLKRPLKEGDTVSLTLSTDLGLKLQVSAIVKKGE